MPEQQAWSAVSVWHNLHRPPSLSLAPSCFLDLLHFPQWLPFFLPLSPFASLTATYLSYSPSPLRSHSTSLWHIYSFLSLFYSIILPLSCYLICSFHSLFISFCDPLLNCTHRCHHFYFLPPCSYSSFPELSLTLYPLLLFSKRVKKKGGGKKVCRKKKELKRDEDRGKKKELVYERGQGDE